MPFTPFHFGPGLLLKAGMPRRFSFLSFATTQVAIDLESLYYLTNGDPYVHRLFHTLPVATLAGVATGALVWGLGVGTHVLIGRLVATLSIGTPRPVFQSELSARGALLGGILGGVTHSIMDSIVHPDVRPFAPLSDANPFLGVIDWGVMETACMVAAVAGALGVLLNFRVWAAAVRKQRM